MGGPGCSVDGNLNEVKFNEPMPWIGIYVGAASLLCAVAMAIDAFIGFCCKKYWFPCKYFSLNATSLTIIAVAVKFSVDLNTPMPRKEDQLTKRSSAILICTVMGNTMPSLGTKQNNDLCMNIIALAILVITIIVNISIQLGTGVVFIFWEEHAFIMILMLVLHLILCFSALTVPTTSSPQFVMGRSVTCTASGALCLVSTLILAEAMIRCYLMPWEFKFCSGESDYKWSTSPVLITQTIAIGVGTIAPTCRWYFAIRFKCPIRGRKVCKNRIINMERYWIQKLVEMKESPLIVRIQNRYCRKFIHSSKNQFLNMCIRMQTGIVFGSKVIQFTVIYIIGQILLFCDCCRELKNKLNSNRSISNESHSESQSRSNTDLACFVLHLEGEEELVELITECNCDATDHWMMMGQKMMPKHLIEPLEQSKYTQGFKGVEEYDSDLVPSLESTEPPNCWALPIVTLTTIALALPSRRTPGHKRGSA